MIHVNSVYDTNKSGKMRILCKTKGSDTYQVEFLNTGTIKTARGWQISQGCVRDPYAKSVCGVACIGNVKTKGKYRNYYRVWHDMIHRCYNPKNKRFNSYRSVTVDPRWLIFKNFYEDAKNIDGFDVESFRRGFLVLDKDIKQRYAQNKVYSKDTCTWVDKHTNNGIQDSQQRPFMAISPDGHIYHDFNITDFAKKHNLNRKNVSAVLHGRGKTVKNWQFFYEEIV